MAVEATEPTEPVDEAPSVEERKGMRGHDDDGNVRPADGRWNLHEPEEESLVCGPANAVEPVQPSDTDPEGSAGSDTAQAVVLDVGARGRRSSSKGS